MTFGPSRISAALKSRLRTTTGKRFSRFLVVAAGAVIASQVTLTVCLGPLGWTAGKSAVAAWATGAIVSYVLSRWAWERKGKPNLLRETVPFFIVAVGTAVVLTLTTKWANEQAIDMGLSHVKRVLFADAAYFLANCVTFLTRFLIFHYILFRDRGSKVSELVAELPEAEFPGTVPTSPSGDDGTGSEPLAATGSAGLPNGSPAWAARDEAPLPEPGTRR
jgi:putative flippase GtrA